MRLVVITGVIHYWYRGELWAYGPYVREIEMWAELFSEVRLAAPCRDEQPQGDCLRVRAANVRISPKLEAGGASILRKLPYLWKLPVLVCQLLRDLARAEAVHVRCPSNLGLLGVLLAPLFCRRMVAKYAGQWGTYPGEPLTVGLQRALLASRWWRGPVTVYGWPEQSAHVVPFFTSAMTESQLARARETSTRRCFEGRLRVLYVGRLSRSKNVDVLLRAVALAKAGGADLTCTVVGAGPELANLRRLVETLGIQHDVEFTGGVDHERVLANLEKAHVLVLASESEGWPKALVEAMAYGLVCIGSKRGLVPYLLGKGRGFVVAVRDVEAIASLLSSFAADPQSYASISRAAAAWAQGFSLERLREELRDLLERTWDCRLAGYSRDSVAGTGSPEAVQPVA